MEWGAAQVVLAVAGALFLVWVVASLHPRLTLSLTSRVVLSAAAGVYLAAAVAVRGSTSPLYVPLVWLVSVSVVVVVARDRMGHGIPRWAHLLPSRARADAAPRRVAAAGEVAVPHPHTMDSATGRVATALDPAASSAELEELAYTSPEARAAVAAHAATPASVLSWLALRGDDAVVAAIAARQESSDATGIPR